MKRRRPHVERRLPLVHQLWSEGKNDREIAEALGVSRHVAYSDRASLELPPRACQRITDDEVAAIRRLHRLGWSDSAIARKLGRPLTAVWRVRAHQLKLPSGGQTSKLRGPRLQRMRRLYDEGFLDEEIAAKVGLCRRTVYVWRKSHGLPAHKIGAHTREKCARAMVALQRAIGNPKTLHFRILAARLGWPGESFPCGAILSLLEDGPRTVQQLGWLYRRVQARFGLREGVKRQSLYTHLSGLHARGLVDRLGGHPRLYALSDAAMVRIHERCRKVGRR